VRSVVGGRVGAQVKRYRRKTRERREREAEVMAKFDEADGIDSTSTTKARPE
jgi:hypothetical protein